MQGNMWVESEVNAGSRFYFTITSQISAMAMDGMLSKLQSYQQRRILFVDTLCDQTGVVQRISDLGLVPIVVHSVAEIKEMPEIKGMAEIKDDKDKQHAAKSPPFDTVIVDGVSVVRIHYSSSSLNV